MRRTLITKEQQLRVIELAQQGLFRKEIGQRTGLSRDIIEAICRKHCIRLAQAKRGKKPDEIRYRAIAKLYEIYPVQRQLARVLGCSQAAISRSLIEARKLDPVTSDT